MILQVLNFMHFQVNRLKTLIMNKDTNNINTPMETHDSTAKKVQKKK